MERVSLDRPRSAHRIDSPSGLARVAVRAWEGARSGEPDEHRLLAEPERLGHAGLELAEHWMAAEESLVGAEMDQPRVLEAEAVREGDAQHVHSPRPGADRAQR